MAAEIIAFRKREKPATKAPATAPSKRLEALDVLRGICVMGMILVAYAGDWGHRFKVLNHADWHGLALADMIFPGFLFCVGVAVPLSFAGRAASQTRGGLSLHILWRAAALIVLGVVLNFIATPDILHFRVPGILQRIGLAYGASALLCLFLGRKSDADFTLKIWPVVAAIAGVLVVYAAMLLLWRTPECPGYCFDSTWALPAVVDRSVFTTAYMWPYGTTNGVVTFDPEGIVATLGAIANVLIGVVASLYIRQNGIRSAVVGLIMLGVFLFVIGIGLDAQIPVIKKIWTPSFALVSSGVSLVVFSLLAVVTDVFGQKSWAYPIKVFGSNATLAFIGISLIDTLMQFPLFTAEPHSLHDTMVKVLGASIADARLASLTYSVGLLVVLGLLLWPAYHKRWFFKL